MRPRPNRTTGILLAMLGIAVGILGLLQASMLPMRGYANWYFASLGLVLTIVGVALAMRGSPSKPANPRQAAREEALPRARVHRSRDSPRG